MTGLDKIIEHIKQESDAAVNKILSDTQAEVDNILGEAKATCEEMSKKLEAKAEADVALAKSRGESAAALTKRKKLLAARQEIITEMLDASCKAMSALPADEYFAVLTKILDKYALNMAGTIILSAKDLGRVPAEFKSAIEKKSLTLSDKKAAIDGGFILVYGDIEENCSFEALFADEKENLQDKVRDLLFE